MMIQRPEGRRQRWGPPQKQGTERVAEASKRCVDIARVRKRPFRKVYHPVKIKQLTKNMAAGELYLGVYHVETLVEVMWLIALVANDI